MEALTTTNNNGVDAVDLTGNGIVQTIVGNAGANILQGLGGDDYLQGRAGNDTLIGGAGEDKFLFNTALNAATNVDTITDMTAGVDIIRLDDAFFAGIGPVGVLNADAFHIGAAAADAEDRIVYNSATGQLFFDSTETLPAARPCSPTSPPGWRSATRTSTWCDTGLRPRSKDFTANWCGAAMRLRIAFSLDRRLRLGARTPRELGGAAVYRPLRFRPHRTSPAFKPAGPAPHDQSETLLAQCACTAGTNRA